MGLYIRESYVNATKGYIIGDTEVYESCHDSVGEVYRGSMKLYGRCTSKMYIDTKKGVEHVGWVFVKRMKYEDCDETYLQETWVSVHDKPDTVARTSYYKYLS